MRLQAGAAASPEPALRRSAWPARRMESRAETLRWEPAAPAAGPWFVLGFVPCWIPGLVLGWVPGWPALSAWIARRGSPPPRRVPTAVPARPRPIASACVGGRVRQPWPRWRRARQALRRTGRSAVRRPVLRNANSRAFRTDYRTLAEWWPICLTSADVGLARRLRAPTFTRLRRMLGSAIDLPRLRSYNFPVRPREGGANPPLSRNCERRGANHSATGANGSGKAVRFR